MDDPSIPEPQRHSYRLLELAMTEQYLLLDNIINQLQNCIIFSLHCHYLFLKNPSTL